MTWNPWGKCGQHVLHYLVGWLPTVCWPEGLEYQIINLQSFLGTQFLHLFNKSSLSDTFVQAQRATFFSTKLAKSKLYVLAFWLWTLMEAFNFGFLRKHNTPRLNRKQPLMSSGVLYAICLLQAPSNCPGMEETAAGVVWGHRLLRQGLIWVQFCS